jgi:hypothetical protein
MPDPFTTPVAPKLQGSLLDGLPGRPGFLFHDAFQPIYLAPPGLLGLVEGRLVIGRWKPRTLAWLDGTLHFFEHVLAEFEGEPSFVPVRRELEAIRDLDAPCQARNAFLFQYLGALTRDLERARLATRKGTTVVRPDSNAALNGSWTVRYLSGDAWVERDVDVPGNWELLPGIDDYAGTMRLTRLFTVPDGAGDGRPVSLRFGGADYFTDVWLNGYHLGGHEGYFEPFSFDVSAYLRTGTDVNVLRVAVTSPKDPSGPGTHVTSGWHDFSPTSAFPNRKTLVKGTLGHHDAKRGGAWSSITSQDGNTGGLWDDVGLRALDPVHVRPGSVRVTTMSTSRDRSGDGHRASARTTLTVTNRTAATVPARIRLLVEPANFDGAEHELVKTARLAPGDNDVVLSGTLSPVQLWNPADHGDPNLYRVTATVEAGGQTRDTVTIETGFRTLSVSPIGESTGSDGAFVVNGREVFVRGTNILPTYWLSEYSPDRVDRDFELLRAGGFNAVLVHNLVAPRHFYERANRNGFLVVQMFPLQWTYEQSHEVFESMTTQLRAMVALLANEPSVVSYEAHNEPDMRTFEDLDNRFFDFDLHTVIRDSDPGRWATTFSSGNHAYPGQFYPLRDDNGFATLPARFGEEEVHGRRIARHRNMPTEFGIQAPPNLELFRELVGEARVRSVLARIRNDPKWVAAGADSWASAVKTVDEAKEVLGRGSWSRVLKTLDWSLLWDVGGLAERVRRLEFAPRPGGTELLSLKLALLLLDVLHYGGFKGENFWFGLWRPASTLEGFVASGQQRQYRLHKDAIEHYLNAGVTGPVVGYFSFMFRDADWEAPTWGVVDAAWTPKKAYRAYVESNHPVRVTLPQALRTPVKLPGDPWFATAVEDRSRFTGAPWAGAEMIVANDTLETLPGAEVSVWVEDAAGVRIPAVDVRREVDLQPQSGWTSPDAGTGPTVADDLPGGTYLLRAQIADAAGRVRSTNTYEIVVPDPTVAWLESLQTPEIESLLDGAPATEGFHYWHGGAVVHRARPGLRGLLAGWGQVETRGIDLYETVQGEHLFRHLAPELAGLAGADHVTEMAWTIRSEVVSPEVKTRTLLRYVELVVRRAETLLATRGRRPARRRPLVGVPAPDGLPQSSLFPAVGRDVPPARIRPRTSPRRSHEE